ncbi:MAG: hypothetical protein K2P81_13730 [Bacteriovoracaceae bacterium]|nr:hypothetical protein [Bacteriovoracaceae bacterium]
MANAYLKNNNIKPSMDGHELVRLGFVAACATLNHHGMTMGNRREIFYYRSKIRI